jgi:hypothetical protein
MKNRIAQSFGALTKSGGKTGEKKTLDLLPFSTVSGEICKKGVPAIFGFYDRL